MARSHSQTQAGDFVLEAWDCEQCCPVLQARFHVPDFEVLRVLLGESADSDADFWSKTYHLVSDTDVAAIIGTFGVQFETGGMKSEQIEVWVGRLRRLSSIPYLVHTGYELPLLLDGRKKLANMYHEYPPDTFQGEERFEHWVEQGILHREEFLEPFETPIKRWLGVRTVHYTPKGEEWRIPAFRLIRDAALKSGGWNEHFERLEGMLYGYEDWQNDWWIDSGLSGGGFGGTRLCCAVTAAGLDWIKAAGYRALPPIDRPTLTITDYEASDEAAMRDFMLETPDAEALAVFNVFGDILRRLLERASEPPWHLPRERIPELNQRLRRSIVVVAHRGIG